MGLAIYTFPAWRACVTREGVEFMHSCKKRAGNSCPARSMIDHLCVSCVFSNYVLVGVSFASVLMNNLPRSRALKIRPPPKRINPKPIPVIVR